MAKTKRTRRPKKCGTDQSPRTSSSPVVECATIPLDPTQRENKGAIYGNDGTIVLQRELVLCGKPRCRKLHGPYWFAMLRPHRSESERNEHWPRKAATPTKLLRVYVGKDRDDAKARRLICARLPAKPKPATCRRRRS